MAKVKIVQSYSDGWSDRGDWEISNTAVAITEGQLLVETGGKVEAMDLVTEDAGFVGVAATGHSVDPNDYRDHVTVLEKCMIEIDVVSGTYTKGDPLKYSAGSATVAHSLAADAGANTIAWAAETKLTAVTRLKVYVDVWRLGKQMGLSNA